MIRYIDEQPLGLRHRGIGESLCLTRSLPSIASIVTTGVTCVTFGDCQIFNQTQQIRRATTFSTSQLPKHSTPRGRILKVWVLMPPVRRSTSDNFPSKLKSLMHQPTYYGPNLASPTRRCRIATLMRATDCDPHSTCSKWTQIESQTSVQQGHGQRYAQIWHRRHCCDYAYFVQEPMRIIAIPIPFCYSIWLCLCFAFPFVFVFQGQMMPHLHIAANPISAMACLSVEPRSATSSNMRPVIIVINSS